MSDVTLRPYRPGDEEAINAGFQRAFGQQRPIEEWRWKFPPEPGRAILLAERDDELLAQYAALPVRLCIGGVEMAAGQVVDAFSVGPPGVFPRLVRHFYATLCGPEPERIALLYGFPGERHLRLGLIKLDYGEPRPVAFWSRAVEAEASREATLRGGALLRRLAGWRVRREVDLAAAERLWRRAHSRYPVAVVRDGSWIARRFCGRPGVDYVHLIAARHGEPGALAVLRLHGGEPPLLSWAELVWDGCGGALHALDAEVIRLARETGAREVHLWLHGDPEAARLLAGRGWERRQCPQRLALTAMSFRPEVEVDAVSARLYFTMADADLV